MHSDQPHILLRLHLRNADRAPHTPTHERIIRQARRDGLAGATVINGLSGYGGHGAIPSSHWSLLKQVPVIVEIIDTSQRLATWIDGPLRGLIVGGLMTLEPVQVLVGPPAPAGDEQPPANPLSSLIQSLKERPDMSINENGVLLRIFIGESDQFESRPLYEAIVQKARAAGLAGATVLRGEAGFGANSVVHKAKLLELSSDLPIVIEMVDLEEKIRAVLPQLRDMVREGMITLETVAIVLYRPAAENQAK